ncbi:hypothetical protein [Naasia sp. SYSU D00948]|uniref:hypothetical protein n=1 Tax=Naasia sp. SYSU D00948 TaxID=2817379 RepID=UPI001B3036B2|nr:hypothetical protein [Naasia sp. SYSU D00948]
MRDLWLEGWLSFAAMSLPAFAALYIVTASTGWWPAVLIAQIAATGVFAAVAGRLRGAGVVLDADGIYERAYLRSTVFTPRQLVAEVLVIPVHRTLLDEVTHQLFMVDAAGRTLLRMRGQLWHRRDLYAAAHHFDVPVRVLEPALTWAQLRRSPYRRNLERFERHPLITATSLAVLTVAVITPVLAVVTDWVSS